MNFSFLRMNDHLYGFAVHLCFNSRFEISQSEMMGYDFVESDPAVVYEIYSPKMSIRVDHRTHYRQFLAVHIQQRQPE